MTDKELKILLIDDESAHREQIEEVINDAGITIINPEFKNDLKSIQKEIALHKPTDLFVDYFYPSNEILPNILDKLGHDIIDDLRIWIISGADITFKEMLENQKKWPNIQYAWLAKPFADNELKAFLEGVQHTHHAQKKFRPDTKLANKISISKENLIQWISSVPLPIRLIDVQSKKVIHANNAWPMARNRPDFHQDISIGPDKLEKRFYWYHSEGIDGKQYMIQSFKNSETPEFLYQEAREVVTQKNTLKKLVKLIFRTMKDAGFLRGRFYQFIRVPNTRPDQPLSGNLTLVHRSGTEYPKQKLPLSYPIGSFWQRRIIKVESEGKGDDLLYDILHHADDMTKKSKDFNFWKRINYKSYTDVDSIIQKKDRFLEIPIFSMKDNKKDCIGFFCFDKWDGNNINDFPVIKEKNVRLVKKLLLSMVDDVRKKIQKEQRIETYRQHILLNKFDKKIKKNRELENVLPMILKKTITLTGATGGLLCFRPGDAGYLEVCSHKVPISKNCIFQLNDKIWPVIVFNNGRAVFCPDLKQVKKDNNGKKHAGINTLEQYAKSMKPEFADWIKNGLKSCVIIPLKSGEEILGSISLYHNKKYCFTQEKAQLAESFLDRCKWFIKFLTVTYEQMHRDRAFMHEIRSNLGELQRNFELLDVKEETSYFKSARLNIRSLLDLSTTKNLLLQKHSGDKSKHFKLNTLIDKVAELYQPRLLFKEITYDIPSPEEDHSHSLKGQKGDFELVLRIVFDNAVKFSIKHGAIKIIVSLNSTGNQYNIKISNTGSISEEQKNNAFIPEQILSENTKDGSHIGLAAAKKIAEFYGAKVSIDDDEKKENVIVDIDWPAKEE